MYQPDLSGSRQRYARTTSPQASPAPGQAYNNASADPRNPTFSLDKYEPRQPIVLSLRPVITPGNNPVSFYHQKAIEKAKSMPRLPSEPQQFLRHSIPNNMSGPNIYLRCLYGLRSGIADEQDFALHHLVKVSYERGDKYKFEGFPLLAESLLEKALEITELLYGFRWHISYDIPESTKTINTLNAAFGTPNLLERLKSLVLQASALEPETAEFMQKLDKLNEAALVIRNMVILEENAAFISKFALFRDFLLIACNLPALPQLTEYRQYSLEMTEQVTKYWDMLPDDPLYLTLLQHLESNDRGVIICALRAIYRIGMDTQSTHHLANVKLSTIERMTAFTLLESDDELTAAALEFLYKFTASLDNVNFVMSSDPDLLLRSIPRLVTLLLHNAIPVEEKILISHAQAPPKNTNIPAIPTDLHQQLLQFPEPERSSRWLRCCFEESPQDDITQIAIWQAYQGRFQNAIPAADFIKNVSNTFATAQAQVINGPTPRFIIKGIRPRRTLVDMSGNPQIKCLWEVARSELYDQTARLAGRHLCNQWLSSRENLWSHMLIDHLGLQRREDGKFAQDTEGTYTCKWLNCLRSSSMSTSFEAGKHVKIHLPESAEAAAKIAEGVYKEAEYTKHTVYHTQTDEKNHPCGIPFTSVLILRNLARFANRRGHDFSVEKGKSKVSAMDRFFGHVKPGLFHTLCVNRTLASWLTDFMKMVEKGENGGDQQKVDREARGENNDIAMT
jgi:chromatin structure-remodeling complex subunit RSC9